MNDKYNDTAKCCDVSSERSSKALELLYTIEARLEQQDNLDNRTRDALSMVIPPTGVSVTKLCGDDPKECSPDAATSPLVDRLANIARKLHNSNIRRENLIEDLEI